MGKYLGKYRGNVVDNNDELGMGRLQVRVSITKDLQPLTWALPCLPFAGLQSGMFVVPAKDSGVWVEFEQGDLDYPIWVGCFWGSPAEVPALVQATPRDTQAVILQTTRQNTLVISDVHGPKGGILLQSESGASISISEVGITIDNGQGATIVMKGPSVQINGEALEVT